MLARMLSGSDRRDSAGFREKKVMDRVRGSKKGFVKGPQEKKRKEKEG